MQAKAQATYRLWARDASHPSLRFKKVHNKLPIYSVRIDLDWRAVGLLQDDVMIWFWIGPHSEYEKLLSRL
ncbi:MAG: ParE family toxin-like protein [Betaproteobacteria bacterium]